MYTFRIKFNRRFYRVNKARQFVGECIRGNSVECVIDGQVKTMEFGGVCVSQRLTLLPNIMINNVVAYTNCELGIFDYIELTGEPIMGVLYKNCAYILLENGRAVLASN